MAEADSITANETWAPAPGFEDLYEVSDGGRVRHKARGNLLGGSPGKSGYLRVSLHAGGRCHTRMIHRLVALAFLGLRPPSLTVNHKNGVKTDNRSANLEYVTAKMNSTLAAQAGLYVRGETHHLSKLTEEKVREIRQLLAAGESKSHVARHFKTTWANVDFIARRVTWKHI